MAVSPNTLSVEFFRNTVEKERKSLVSLCEKWRTESQNIPQNIEGDVLVAIGQAELLMRKRFAQFFGLIDDCEFKRGEKETTLQDLQGFWDIIYFQVEDVQSKFDQLSELQKNNWIIPQPKAAAVMKKKLTLPRPQVYKNGPMKAKVAGGSAMRAHILAARQRLKDANGQKKDVQGSLQIPPTLPVDKENGIKSPQKAVFDAGFFKVVTPVKKIVAGSSIKRCSSQDNFAKVLSSAILRERVRNTPIVHKDYSPCMRVTRSMKLNARATKLKFDE